MDKESGVDKEKRRRVIPFGVRILCRVTRNLQTVPMTITQKLVQLGISKTVNQWDSQSVFVLSYCPTVLLKDSRLSS